MTERVVPSRSRGRSIVFGLGLGLAACGPPAPGPVSEPVPDHEPARVESRRGVRHIVNVMARERLHRYSDPGDRKVELLFLAGRATTPSPTGGTAWADLDGGRVLSFDDRGRVAEVAAGDPGDAALNGPAFVSFDRGDLVAAEPDGSAIRFAKGNPPRREDPTGLPARVGGGRGPLVAVRTVLDLQLAPLPPDAPLLWIGKDAGTLRAVGRIEMPDQAMLAALVNAGWVAPMVDGSVVFASAVRPELRRYASDGELLWVSTWPRDPVPEPGFGIDGGTLVPRFRLVHQAITQGPDGLLYALATSGHTGPADRLLVFRPDGSWIRESPVPADAAIYASESGHSYVIPPDQALGRTDGESLRAAFHPFDLAELGGPGRLRLEDHRGKVVVVNFWASWCAPCRHEMPLLDSLALELNPRSAVVLGLNEDVRPADALRFIDELGGVSYPVARGSGALREEYGYRGLPYTVVLDREGRIFKAFYGFGRSITSIREATMGAIGETVRDGVEAAHR